MIAVDTSVWVVHLNDDATQQVLLLRDIIVNHRARLVVGIWFCARSCRVGADGRCESCEASGG